MSEEPYRSKDDDDFWMAPPSGEVVDVECRLNLRKVYTVDTQHETAFVSIDVTAYWTDPRLAAKEDGQRWEGRLPAKLWGPRLKLKNALGDLLEADTEFQLVNDDGRMKRARNYTGSIDNPMQLEDFPFDCDVIELIFESWSWWMSFDNEWSGAPAEGQEQRWSRIVTGKNEGSFLDLRWDGRIAEWDLHGVSSRIEEFPKDKKGQVETQLAVSFHVTRMPGYYFWKALLPLYLLTGLSFTTFEFAPSNLEARSSTIATYFLSAFAMLYVVGSSLPKVQFLTKVDVVIVLTTVSLFLTGVVSRVLFKIADDASLGIAEATKWNRRIELAMITVYLCSNCFIFAPAFNRQQLQKKKLRDRFPKADQIGSSPGQPQQENGEIVLNPTAEETTEKCRFCMKSHYRNPENNEIVQCEYWPIVFTSECRGPPWITDEVVGIKPRAMF